MIAADLFIGAIVVAIVEAIKTVFPQVSGAITTLFAMLVGALVAVIAPHIGIATISVAVGMLDGLAAAGVHTIASATASKS